MSWDMWHVAGVGFLIENVNRETVLKFVENHRNTIMSIYPENVIKYDIDPLFENEDEEGLQYDDGYNLFSEVVADVMSAEIGANFCAPHMSEDGECPVFYVRSYPWEMKAAEKDLTLDKLVDMMQEYADELGVTVDTELDVVYSG